MRKKSHRNKRDRLKSSKLTELSLHPKLKPFVAQQLCRFSAQTSRCAGQNGNIDMDGGHGAALSSFELL